MKLWQKIILTTVLLIVAAGALIYIFQNQILTGLARVLIVDDSLQPADIIYILNGEVNTRPFHAAELFEQGFAPKIVIPREEDGPASEVDLYPNGTDISVEILQEKGISAEEIVVIEVKGGVTSTRDEALVLRQYVETHNIQSVIVVTSAFHTRRSQWIFRKVLADSGIRLQIAAAPQWQFDETDWWQTERGLLMFVQEYLKFGFYIANY
ncbi:MAG: YdcF family protein [Anaerolineae bacterium]|nr:YdcF family protein [Anaerolineae bacterium]